MNVAIVTHTGVPVDEDGLIVMVLVVIVFPWAFASGPPSWVLTSATFPGETLARWEKQTTRTSLYVCSLQQGCVWLICLSSFSKNLAGLFSFNQTRNRYSGIKWVADLTSTLELLYYYNVYTWGKIFSKGKVIFVLIETIVDIVHINSCLGNTETFISNCI